MIWEDVTEFSQENSLTTAEISNFGLRIAENAEIAALCCAKLAMTPYLFELRGRLSHLTLMIFWVIVPSISTKYMPGGTRASST